MVIPREKTNQRLGSGGVEHRTPGNDANADEEFDQQSDEQQVINEEQSQQQKMAENRQSGSSGNVDQMTHQMTTMMQGLMSDFMARQERRLDGLTGTIVAECEKRIRQELAKLGTQSQATNVSSSSPPSQLFPSTANMTLLGHSSQRPAFSSARQQQTGTGQQRQHITFPQNQQLSVQQPAQITDPLLASMDRMTKANMDIMRQFIAVNEGNQFAMISNQISNLSGNEGRTGIKNFFGNLEASTPGWSVDRRAQLLATHLTGAAKNLFESMDDWEKVDYDRIKEQVLESMSGLGSKRHEAKAILERGLWPASGDNLREYGLRVLALMRDSKVDGTPNATVEDDAKCYFLGKMRDSRVHDSLAMWMDDMVYRDLIDKAEKLRQNLEIRRTNMGPRFNQGFNSSTVNRPAPAFVPNSSGSASNQQSSSNAPANFSTNKNQTWSARPNYQNSSNANFTPVNRNLQAPQAIRPIQAPPANNNTRFQNNPNSGRPQTKAIVADEANEFTRNDQLDQSEMDGNFGYLGMMNMDESENAGTGWKEAKPCGPKLGIVVEIFGVRLKALLDSGATVNVITQKALDEIGTANSMNLELKFGHEQFFKRSFMADESMMEFAGGITLPVKRGSATERVQFHIIQGCSPFSVVIGTAALADLGFSIVDSQSGFILLGNEKNMNTIGMHGKQKKKDDAELAGSVIVSPLGQALVALNIDQPDGDYLLGNGSENFLVNIVNGKSHMVVNNHEYAAKYIEMGESMGKVEVWNCENGLGMMVCAENEPADEVRMEMIKRDLHIASEISVEQNEELSALLAKFGMVFALTDEELGQTDVVEHEINLENDRPFRVPPRPIPFALRDHVTEMVDDYLKRGVIVPSKSPYCSPVVLVKKKTGELRFCVDFRQLNARTRKDSYPIPDIDTTILALGNKKFFSTLDLRSGYWQVRLAESSQEKSAFGVMGGLFQFKVMPFGLANAPSCFQRLMEQVFVGLIGKFVFIYLDDILIASETWDEHLIHLEQVLERLVESGLKLKPSKCELVVHEVEFLGHLLTPNGIKMSPSKVKAINEYPVPKKVKELQSFIGLAGYYRKFIRGFAMIAKPLHQITRQDKGFRWSEECQNAFDELKQKIAQDVTLPFPDFKEAMENPKRRFLIQTDASKEGIAGILNQLDEEGKPRDRKSVV